MSEVTHVRKFNYKAWFEDIFKFGTILFFIILANHMSLAYLDNMKLWPVLIMCQIGYTGLYFISLVDRKNPAYWTYVEVKQLIIDN